jgi:Rrf2 family transcriptional regulator, cysteine metabolism repressor
MVSQKCQYAIRAVFELAKRNGGGPVKIKDIAEAQAIPPRFLEIILNQLRRSGFVHSRRGATGGYFLVRQPESMTVGEIVRFVEGPLAPVACMTDKTAGACSLDGHCAFIDMWRQVAAAISEVYDNTSFQNLVDNAAAVKDSDCPLTYFI